MIRTLVALLCMGLLLLQPAAAVAASPYYSTLGSPMTWQPDGQPKSLMCSQSGILDIARNYGQSVNFSWNNAWSCEDNLALPGGYIGVSVVGYMNGQVCGRSGTYYSNTTTSAWQLWINLCSNPGGSQTFFTQPWEYGWNGINYTKSSGPNSPVRTY